MEAAQTRPIRFNNHLLFWQDHKERKDKYLNKSRSINERYISVVDVSEGSEVETYRKNTDDEQEKKSNKHHNNYKRNKDKSEDTKPQMHNFLQKILERLERLEARQGQTVLANRS